MYKFRDIEGRVEECLGVFRVVSLTGARQVGKTTLLKRLCARTGRRYVTLEDPVARAAAHSDPDAWLAANPAPLAIDEIQHVPALFPALKRVVDANEQAGAYLITGSAMWLSMKAIGESLAGRAAILEMWPFRVSEWLGHPWDWGRILEPDAWRALPAMPGSRGESLADTILRGGYPEMTRMKHPRDRRTWAESYLRTYLQRDVLDLVRLEYAAEFTRLIRLMAAQTGAMVNQSALARDLGLPQPTVRRHLEWLRTTYQCHLLPPYSTHLGKRLVKTPKAYWSDTGMAAGLSGLGTWADVEVAARTGALMETWVINDLHAWAAGCGGGDLYFWRSHDGAEVDAVLERNGSVVAIEIKCGHRVDVRDLKGLRDCRAALGKRFSQGIVLYGGSEPIALEDRIAAVPLAVVMGA